MDITQLKNEDLIRLTEGLAADMRANTCDLIESLAEIDRRKLYQDFNCASLFEYCLHKLRMSDGAAYRRIRAARAFQCYPPVKFLLRTGQLTLESLVLLHPFLNDADAGELVKRATGKRVWEVERLVAGRRTEAPRRDSIRFVPSMALEPAPSKSNNDEPLFKSPAPLPATPPAPLPATPPALRAMPETVSPGVRISFTADEEFFKLLKEAQAAMRHKYPSGRLDGVFRDALEALLRKKRPRAS